MIVENTVTAGSFKSSGFQMKGNAKRKVIMADHGERPEVREAVLGIDGGVIKSVSVPISQENLLVIPLPPSRTDIVRAIKSNDESKEIVSQKKIDSETTSATQNEVKNVIPKTLEQLAAEELIAEMNGSEEHSSDNLLTIPVTGGNTLNTASSSSSSNPKKSAPLLSASLAPELLGLKDDGERFKADINTRPDDMNVRSDAYKSVRIADFGAAMLRGMGWDGQMEEKKEEEKIIPRDNRLGLGE